MPMRWEMILMSNEMNKEMSQGTDVQTEERYQVTKRDLRKQLQAITLWHAIFLIMNHRWVRQSRGQWRLCLERFIKKTTNIKWH